MSDQAPHTPQLDSGETLIARFPTTLRGIARQSGVAVAIFAVITLLWSQLSGDFDLSRWLLQIAIFGAVFSVINWLLVRRQHWVLTDRRVISRGGDVMPLSPDMRTRSLLGVVYLGSQHAQAMALRGLDDPQAVADQIAQAAKNCTPAPKEPDHA